MLDQVGWALSAGVGVATLYGLGYAVGRRRNGFVKKEDCVNFREEMRVNINDVKLDTEELKKDVGEVKENVSYIRGKLDASHN